MSDFVQWKESDVISRFGVPKDELVLFRNSLTEGEHWERMPQGKRPLRTCPIVFTETGWAAVVHKFGLIEVHGVREVGDTSGVIVMEPAAADPEVMEKADVLRADYPNHRVMLVKTESGKTVFCNVFDSRPFKARMPVVVKYRGGRWYCEHRPTSVLRLNTLLKRNSQPQ
jgi:hypothetical protein